MSHLERRFKMFQSPEVIALEQEKKRIYEELSALSPHSRRYRRLFKSFILCHESLKLVASR